MLALGAPRGLPLTLGCLRRWRLSCWRTAWMTGVGPGGVTIPEAMIVGLLVRVAIVVGAEVLSLPVWVALWWLATGDHGGRLAGSAAGAPLKR